MKKTLIAIFLITATGGAARAEIKFVPILDADLRGNFSSVSGKDSSFGEVFSLFAMPAVSLDQNNIIIPALNSAYTGNEKVIEEETLFLHRFTNFGSLGFKHKFSEKWDSKILVEAN